MNEQHQEMNEQHALLGAARSKAAKPSFDTQGRAKTCTKSYIAIKLLRALRHRIGFLESAATPQCCIHVESTRKGP